MPTALRSRDSRSLEPAHFVGRAADVDRVRALTHEASLGAGSTLLIAGESGVGKSRFLRECASATRDTRVVQLQCRSLPTSDELLSQLAEALDPSRRPAATPTFSGLRAMLVKAASRKPVTILVDDAQAASPVEAAVLEWLHALSREHRMVLVLMHLLDGAWSPAARGLQRWTQAGAPLQRLEPLDDGAMELLVRSLGTPATPVVDTNDLREILTVAQGNPRLAIDLVRCAAARREAGPLVASSAIAEVAQARERLSAQDFEIVQLCSVVAEAFRDEWIVAISGISRERVADGLQAGCDAGILAEEEQRPGWFRFRRTAFRPAILSSLVSSKLRLTHERVVQRLPSLDGGDRPSFAIIADHWQALGDRERAAEWLLRAADETMERGAYSQAAPLYARAVNHLAPATPEWFRANERFIRCGSRLGEWARIIPVLEGQLTALGPDGDPELASAPLWDLFYAYLNDGNREAARRTADRLAALGLAESPVDAAKSTLILAYALCYSGRREEAAVLAASIDPKRLSDDETMLRYLVARASIDALHAPLQQALSTIDRAAELAKRLGVRGTVHCYGDGAEISLRWGSLSSGLEYTERAAQAAQRSVGEANSARRAVVRDRIRCSVLAGELDAAKAYIESSLSWHDEGKHNQSFIAGMGVLVAMRTGDAALVHALFDPQLLEQAVAARDSESCGLMLPGYSEVMQARGMGRELRDILGRCASGAVVDPYAWAPLCVARYGTLESAEAAAALLTRHFEGSIAPAPAAHCTLVEAILARRRAKPIRSSELGRSAAAQYRAIGWRLQEATALEIAGDRELAITAYRACGATVDVERLQREETRKARRASFGGRLTSRELEAVRLVARGHSNAEIARALQISVRTVHHHLEASFSKLGLRARWQITPEVVSGLDGS